MADATPSRLGQVNEAGDVKALFLKKFAGETLAIFNAANVSLDKHSIRTIDSGKSAQFPLMGTVASEYHTPGAEISGGTVKHAEQVLTIDDMLIAPTFIANIDEAMNHYDVRSHYTEQTGYELARQWDVNVFQTGILAARATHPITGQPGGTALTNAAYATDGSVLAGGLFAAAQKFDENNLPEEDRNFFVRPAQYYLMAQTTDVINRDWGGAGAYSDGKVLRVAGVNVFKSNHVPSTNVNTGPTKYQGDFSTTVGLMMNKHAVGTVKLLDLAMESEYQINRQGTLMLAKYAIGHGVLNPSCAIEFKTA